MEERLPWEGIEEPVDKKAPEPGDEEKSIVKAAVPIAVTVPTDFGQGVLLDAKQRINVLAGLKRLAIGYTTPDEWVSMGGKPYLEASGCMKFAEIFGVSFRDSKVETLTFSDERGPVCEFYASVVAEFRGRTCPGEGVSSTADEFFNGKEDDPTAPDKKRVRRLPMSEIDRPSVRKKSITQAMASATKKILGLTFTWDEVNEALASAGKDAGKSVAVEFKKPTGKGILTDTKSQIGKMILAMVDPPGDKVMAADFLEHLTSNPEKGFKGKRSVIDLSDKQAEWIFRTVKREFDKFTAEQAGGAGNG